MVWQLAALRNVKILLNGIRLVKAKVMSQSCGVCVLGGGRGF